MNFYNILKVQRNADPQQIREAYKQLVKTEHPDKGGDAEKFKQIQRAYDVLKDEQKRAYYDQTGEVMGEGGGGGGPQQGGMPFGFGGGGIPFDMGNLFNMFGGGGGGGQRKKRQGKAPPRVTQLPLTLKDFYHGRVFRIQLERQRFCKDCKGEGSTSLKTCGQCGGSGTKMSMIQVGPMVMHSNGPCDGCAGQGKQKGDNCWSCKGSGMFKQEKVLEVRIEPGMGPGETVVFSGESSDSHDFTEPGDVNIEIQAADETTGWIRKGNDLHIQANITWTDALVGCKVRLHGHPGYEQPLVFRIPAGVIHGETVRIPGYGMPKRGLNSRGDCIIVLNVAKINVFEKEALEQNKEALQTMFSHTPLTTNDNDHHV